MERLFKFVAVTFATLLTSQCALAATHAFAPFNVLASGPASSPQSVPLSGAPAASYNGYTISLDWTAGTDNPQSIEAIPALVSQAAPNSSGATFYADPGASPNSYPNGISRTLSWGGYFDTNYTGGNPLHFWYVQTFVSSTANWSNVAVTLFSINTQTSNTMGNTTGGPTWQRPNTTGGLSNTGSNVPYQVVPFTVDTSGPYLVTTDTSGTAGYDGYLALYGGSFSAGNPLANIVALNDDLNSAPELKSQVSVALTAGTQYFLVQSGFNNGDFGAWTGTIVGPGLATVPEPAIGFAMLFAMLSATRPRRR
ncbi:hypothetical protein BH09PLA1_BH09PLA1_27160 [soil metagenome]